MRRHTKDRPADRTVCKRSNNVPIATIVTNCQSRSGRESRTMMDWIIVSTCSMKFHNWCRLLRNKQLSSRFSCLPCKKKRAVCLPDQLSRTTSASRQQQPATEYIQKRCR